MPCYGCGARQTDPERGPSLWKRGLVREHQVLVCPSCQRSPDWTAGFSACARCGNVSLIRRLDHVECQDCHLVRPAREDPARQDAAAGASDDPPAPVPGEAADPPQGGRHSAAADPALAAEVARALDRALGHLRSDR